MKHNYIKRLFTALLLFCSTVAMAHDFEVDGIYYNITSQNKTVGVTYKGTSSTQYSDEYSGAVIIPENVTYNGSTYSVTSIEDEAFYGCKELTSVEISNSVTSIGEKAFYGCTKLTNVHISDLAAWRNIDFADKYANPMYFARNLYLNAKLVTELVIPEGVTNIKDYVFYNCNCLTSVAIPNSVTNIGAYAFYGCTGITSVTIPNSVKSIGSGAFAGCNSLTDLHIEDGGTELSFGSYGSAAASTRFAGCPLVNIYIGRNLSYYYNEYDNNSQPPFSDLGTLRSVIIGDSVTSISSYMFLNSAIKSIIIGSSVTSIGNIYRTTLEKVVNYSSLNITKGSSDNGGIAYYADYVYNNCTTVGDFVFSTLNGVNYLVAYTGNETSIELPADYNGGNYEIAEDAFSGCHQLVSVVIPNSVTRIGNGAFEDCTSLITVTVGTSVQFIHRDAFPEVKKFIFLGNTPPRSSTGAIYCPKGGVKYVSNAATYGYGTEYSRLSSMFEVDGVKYVPLSTKECDVIDCRYDASAANVVVDSVVLYKSRKMTVKNINDYSFYGNDYIKQVYVNNDGYVGCYAFNNCDNIAGDLIVENNGYIADYAFYSCDRLTNVKVANNGYIGSYAFAESFTECSGDGVVEIFNPSYIGASAFQDCIGIVTANVQNHGDIGASAFRRCYSMRSLTLGENVGSLGNYAFDNCTSLQGFAVPNNIPSMGNYCFSNCTSLQKMAVGNGVTKLYEGTFKNCTSLTDMSIGVNIDTIHHKVFYNCSSLPAINVPEAIKLVRDSVFYNCNSLALVVFEDRAGSVVLGSNGESPMFSSCPLDSVYVGGSLSYSTIKDKGYSPFYGNKYLRSIAYNDVEKAIYDKEFMNCSNLQNVYLGNGTRTIGNEAFRNCSALPRITTPNSVTSMGKFAFAGCSSLKTVLIGDGTDGIKESSFRNCTSLVDIKLGSGIGSIAVSSFYNCSSLPEITIPSATTSIADSVFYNCKSLARFFAEDGDLTLSIGKNAKNANSGAIGSACPLFIHCQLDSVYLGRNLSYNQTQEYGYSPFYFNKTLRAAVIGDKVKSVFPNQFYQCRKLEYVSVGDGVTSVGNWAFSSCVSLDHFSFGVGLETIGKEAFSDCTLVTKIVSSREVPPVCGEQALADIDMWECTVYVPEEYIDAYMEAEQWCEFWIEGAEYRLQFMVDGEVYTESMVKYNAEIELPVDPEKTGYTFKGWNLQGYSKSVWNEVKLAENADAMLYTNAPCTTSTYGDQFVSWNVLFDGNLNTLFHSEYGNRQTVDGLDHYLRVDMGEGNKVGRFKFTYTTRSVLNNNNVSPKTIVVEGSNTPDGEYTEIAMLTNLPGTKSTVYTSRELGNENSAYRYIRYRVIETHGNYKDNNHPYFAISEFGMSYEEIDVNFSMPERMPAYDMTVNAEFEANEYTITYIVDGEVYDTVTAAYESAITPIEAPVKDGYTFNSWEALPQTMPAENIEVVAIYDEIPTEVTITIGQYGSTVYSSQYALDFSNVDGLQAYAATGYNTSTGVITMTKIETSAEGMGLYLLAAPGEYIVPIIEYSDDNSLNMLVGNLEKSIVNAVSDDGLFANYKYTIKSGDSTPKFYQYSDNSSISAGKAYLQISLDWIGGNASKAIEIRLDNGDATDIDEVKGDSTDDASQNGEVKTVYDLQGRAVENSSNGIYIVNGRKVYEK